MSEGLRNPDFLPAGPETCPLGRLSCQLNRLGQQSGTHSIEVEAISTKTAIPDEGLPAAEKEGVIVHIWDGQTTAVALQPHVQITYPRVLLVGVAGGDERAGDDEGKAGVDDGAYEGAEILPE